MPESTVPCFGRWETQFAAASAVDAVTFIAPDGSAGQRPTFRHQPVQRMYDLHGYEQLTAEGEPVLAVRVTPDQPGRWQWRATCGAATVATGSFTCMPSATPGFVTLSPHDPRYFAHTTGAAYVPIGLNLCGVPQDALPRGGEFAKGTATGTLGVREYERWFRRLSANGGNFARLWLSHPSLAVEGEAAGEVDLVRLARLDGIVAAARASGVRLKLCLEHFRRVTSGDLPPVFVRTLRDPESGAAPADMDEWYQHPRWQVLWWRKLDAYLARYADDPVVMAWELWNEIDCCHTSGWTVQRDWTARTLARLKQRTPRNLVTNSLGSFDWEDKVKLQQDFHLPEMDFQQVHRYLDQGAALACCQADTVVLSIDAVQRARRPDRPVLLAETGAVNDCHTGPFRYYRWDDDGLIFHDTTYAAFFAGAAGSGHLWHWDVYVDQKGLWPGFRALADAVASVAVDREAFVPHDCSTADAWCLVLRGRTCSLVWLRHRADRWDHVLRDQQVPAPITVELALSTLGLTDCRVALFRPWPDDAQGDAGLTGGVLRFPQFRHGLVARFSHA